MADRYDKALVAQRLKFIEIFVAALAAWGYVQASLPLLYVALLGFGILAALFGPIKYGILPDHLRREQLPIGNALVEGATFVAILLGTIAGGLASRDESSQALCGTGHRICDRVLVVGAIDPGVRRGRTELRIRPISSVPRPQ